MTITTDPFLLTCYVIYAQLVTHYFIMKQKYFKGVPFTGTDYTLQYWPFGDFMCRFVSEFHTFLLPF